MKGNLGKIIKESYGESNVLLFYSDFSFIAFIISVTIGQLGQLSPQCVRSYFFTFINLSTSIIYQCPML